ncbi:MAG TPA: hypothetical protein PLV83_04925 [Bacilli bacterium]|nr:hypothetical protein [Bacilli bacterium]
MYKINYKDGTSNESIESIDNKFKGFLPTRKTVRDSIESIEIDVKDIYICLKKRNLLLYFLF